MLKSHSGTVVTQLSLVRNYSGLPFTLPSLIHLAFCSGFADLFYYMKKKKVVKNSTKNRGVWIRAKGKFLLAEERVRIHPWRLLPKLEVFSEHIYFLLVLFFTNACSGYTKSVWGGQLIPGISRLAIPELFMVMKRFKRAKITNNLGGWR